MSRDPHYAGKECTICHETKHVLDFGLDLRIREREPYREMAKTGRIRKVEELPGPPMKDFCKECEIKSMESEESA